MGPLKKLFLAEPVAVVRIVELGIIVAVLFGVEVTTEQLAAIIALLMAVGTFLSRAFATPTETVSQSLRDAAIPSGTRDRLRRSIGR